MGGRLRGLILRRWGWGLWVKVWGGWAAGCVHGKTCCLGGLGSVCGVCEKWYGRVPLGAQNGEDCFVRLTAVDWIAECCGYSAELLCSASNDAVVP